MPGTDFRQRLVWVGQQPRDDARRAKRTARWPRCLACTEPIDPAAVANPGGRPHRTHPACDNERTAS